MMTFVGIFVYLIIDNLILPIRTDETTRLAVIGCIEATSSFVSNVMSAMKMITDYGRGDHTVTKENELGNSVYFFI